MCRLSTVLAAAPEVLADGGSCIAGPDGAWIVEPVAGAERLVVNRERQGVVHAQAPDDG